MDWTILSPHCSRLTNCAKVWCECLALFGLLCACTAQPEQRTFLPPLQIHNGDGVVDKQASQTELARYLPAAATDRELITHLRQLQSLSKRPWYTGNNIELLVDGPETYSTMLQAIANAKSHVFVETYIFANDDVGEQFRTALLQRRRAGVEVRLMYDSFGSLGSDAEFFQPLIDAGVKIVEFHPINPIKGVNPLETLVRNHRKLLVVDGVTAFTGGINITEDYSSSSIGGTSHHQRQSSNAQLGWRDTHIRIHGPAVVELQQLFLETWHAQGGESGTDLLLNQPVAHFQGQGLVAIIAAEGGDSKLSQVRDAYLHGIDNAKHSVWITQAYFIPDSDFVDRLKVAAKRGVDVRLLLPGVSDSDLALTASRAYYQELLEAGVRIWETDGFVMHAKTAVIDGYWSTVGSSNLDNLSFFFNYEINAVLIDTAFANEMEQQFVEDLTRCNEISLAQWQQRPLIDQVKQGFTKLFKVGL